MARKLTKSFYDWCLENNRHDILDRWDYELNNLNPRDVGYMSNYRIYLKCPIGKHGSETYKADIRI